MPKKIEKIVTKRTEDEGGTGAEKKESRPFGLVALDALAEKSLIMYGFPAQSEPGLSVL